MQDIEVPTKKRKLDESTVSKPRKKPTSATKKVSKKTKKPRVVLEYEIESEQTRQRLHNWSKFT